MCQPELLLGGVGTDAHNPLLKFLQGLLGDVVGLKRVSQQEVRQATLTVPLS